MVAVDKMSTYVKIILIFASVILAAIAVWVVASRQGETIASHESGPASQPKVAIAPVGIITAQTNVETEPPQSDVQPTMTQPAARPQHGVAKKGPKRVKKKVPLQDPTARVALGLVGVDPDAEAYWEQAIFDRNLPDKEREDLMEDLNEVGFSDPKNPGQEDLPLILNRIALIEQIAPYADPFMQRHLGEAYKDLNNMLEGKPVP